MSQKKSLSLGLKMTGSIGVITLVTILLIISSVITLKGQKDDSTVINIAGRQRMLSQKMSKEAMAIQAGLAVEKNRAELKKTHKLFESSLQNLINGNSKMNLPATRDKAILKQMNQVERLWGEFSNQIRTILNSSSTDDQIGHASKLVLEKNIPLLTEMNKAVGMYASQSQAKVKTLTNLLYSGGVLVLIVTILIWLFTNRAIVRPLRNIVDMVEGMGKGDLDQRLNMRQNDEIGQLGQNMDRFAADLNDEILTAFQALAEGNFTFEAQGLIAKPLTRTNQKLSELVMAVQQASHKVSTDAIQVSATSTSLADGATQQAAALEEISASMTQMSEQTTNNAQNAQQVNQLSNVAKKSAEQGNTHMQAMIKAMTEINEAGQNISKIIKVIDEIAFQTNLLALNAAVEAARAGQHGKGFAVVAEEVRNLASRSAKAASETTALILGSVEKTENGAQIADQTAEALNEISQGVIQVSELVEEIATASHEQSMGISQANSGLTQLDSVNQNTTASAEETAAIAETLSAETQALQDILGRFKVSTAAQMLIS